MSRSWAVVTGASSGLGVAYAERVASMGTNVVLSARRADLLESVAADLRERFNVDTRTVTADLGDQDQRHTLIAELQELDVAYLINNAGFGTMGEFAEADPDRMADELNLNVVALTDLTRAAVPGMIARRRGAVINVASSAAFQPVPNMAVYAASKAYVLRFTTALWDELRPTGVRALAICPGPTDTSFFTNAGNDEVMSNRRTPSQVVDTTFKALRQHRPYIVDGGGNVAMAFATRFAPAGLQTKLAKLVATN